MILVAGLSFLGINRTSSKSDRHYWQYHHSIKDRLLGNIFCLVAEALIELVTAVIAIIGNITIPSKDRLIGNILILVAGLSFLGINQTSSKSDRHYWQYHYSIKDRLIGNIFCLVAEALNALVAIIT